MNEIDIVVPVYKEEAGISLFDNALRNILRPIETKYSFKIIYVLDRSPDGSYELLKALTNSSRNTTVLHLSSRFGHQMSLVAGLDQCRGDAVIMMDGDLQHPPELIPTLLERFEQGFDIVQTIRRYDNYIPMSKRFSSRLFYWIQNCLSPVELKDGAADFRLISRKVLLVFQNSIREHNQFLRALFQWVGFSRAYVPFTSPPRQTGVTKYNFSRLLAFFIDGVISFSRLPLRLVTVLGFVLSVLSAIYGLYLLFVFSVYGNLPRGYTSLILVILFIGGLQLMVSGVVGEYIGHIFDEVKARPLYVIDEIVASKPE